MLTPRHNRKSIPKENVANSRTQYSIDPDKIKFKSHAYYTHNQERVCAYERDKYVLDEPKPSMKEQYDIVRDIQKNLLKKKKQNWTWFNALKSNKRPWNESLVKAVWRLVNKARKEHADSLFKTIRTASWRFRTYSFNGTILLWFHAWPYALPIDECGKYILAKEVNIDNGKCTNKIQPMKWSCTSECKPLTDSEISAIVEFKETFDRPIQEMRHAIDVRVIETVLISITQNLWTMLQLTSK